MKSRASIQKMKEYIKGYQKTSEKGSNTEMEHISKELTEAREGVG